jgi:hypothetical protein
LGVGPPPPNPQPPIPNPQSPIPIEYNNIKINLINLNIKFIIIFIGNNNLKIFIYTIYYDYLINTLLNNEK